MRFAGKLVGQPAVATPQTSDHVPSPPPVAQKGAWLGLGRIADQGAIGLVGLVLAARVSVEGFAALAILLVGYSVSATLGDLGLGHEMLRLGAADRARRSMLDWVRSIAVVSLSLIHI